MIDESKIKEFWEKRASFTNNQRLEGVANLEANKEMLDLKVKLEFQKVMSKISFSKDWTVLDLGAGAGQWSLRFASRVRKVVAVEFSENMIQLFRGELEATTINNVEIVNEFAQNYREDRTFDFVYISGLLIYLNNDDLKKTLKNLSKMTTKGSTILLRDGTGVEGKHIIDNRYSEALQANYSAVYRTREEYLNAFEEFGFKCTWDEDMFEKYSPLNKWKETRLRLYEFTKNS